MIKEGNCLEAENHDKAFFHYIVPVFNTPVELLDQCIYSLCQSLYNASRADGSDYITIIDDCSDPKYSELIQRRIVDQYSIQYKRLEKNAGGLFQTRCQALKLLNIYDTDYVCFIDSDDEVEIDFHSKLEEAYWKYGNSADIYQCDFLEVKDKYKRIYVNTDNKEDMVNLRWNLSGKFFKKKLFNTAIEHPLVNCFLGEDLLHSIMMYPRINKIVPFNGRYIYHVRKSKTDKEGTNYRDDEVKNKILKDKYMELIKYTCEDILGIKNPHRFMIGNNVLLILKTIKNKDDYFKVYDELMNNYHFFKDNFKNYTIKVCIRSTLPKGLFTFPTFLNADQYMEIKDLKSFDRSLLKYYTNNCTYFIVAKDGELLSKTEWEALIDYE